MEAPQSPIAFNRKKLVYVQAMRCWSGLSIRYRDWRDSGRSLWYSC